MLWKTFKSSRNFGFWVLIALYFLLSPTSHVSEIAPPNLFKDEMEESEGDSDVITEAAEDLLTSANFETQPMIS